MPGLAIPPLLSAAEVGAIFNREPRTIREWIARGVLIRVKVGNSVFIPWSQVAAICDGEVPSKTSSSKVKK